MIAHIFCCTRSVNCKDHKLTIYVLLQPVLCVGYHCSVVVSLLMVKAKDFHHVVICLHRLLHKTCKHYMLN